MNKIVEEAMTNMIREIHQLRSDVDELKKNQKNFNQNPPVKTNFNKPGQATENQINYIKGLGGNPTPEMTKEEAGLLIDELLKAKKERIVDGAEIPEVVEPAEVDTDAAGLDEEDLM